MLRIRQAVPEDMPAIIALYDGVIDNFQSQTDQPGWRRGVYPTEGYLAEAVRAGTLYLGELDGTPAAGMILKRGNDEAYRDVPWSVDAADDEVAVIHTLGVDIRFGGRGIGRQMTEKAVALAREQGCKAVRLDALESNGAALRMYEKVGFRYVATKKIWYVDTGLVDFLLYEYLVQKDADFLKKMLAFPQNICYDISRGFFKGNFHSNI